MFMTALVFGAGQVLLTWRLTNAAEKKCGKKIFLFFMLKFLLYGIGIYLLILKHIWKFDVALYGFAAGVPIAAIGLFVYKTIYKK